MADMPQTAEIIARLREQHPDARCQLEHETPLQLMIAAILTAQSTERKVNQVTPLLFSRYESAAEFVAANRQDLEKLIRPHRILPAEGSLHSSVRARFWSKNMVAKCPG